MNHNLSKQKRGRSSLNRLGVATLSSLLAVGLTPAFVNLAFAETKDAPKAKAAVTNEGKSDLTLYLKATPAEGVKGTWGSDSPIKATVAKTGENCPEWTGDVTFTKETGPFNDGKQYYKATKDNLDFTSGGNVPAGPCTYTLTATKADDEAHSAGWDITDTIGKNKTITVTFSKATTAGKSGAEAWKDQTENTGAKAVIDPVDGMYEATYTGKTSVKFNPGTGAKFKEGVTTTLSGEKGSAATEGVPTSESFEKTPEDQILAGWNKQKDQADAEAVTFPANSAEQEYYPVWKDAVTFDAGEGNSITVDEKDLQTLKTEIDASKPKTIPAADKVKNKDGKKIYGWKLTKKAGGDPVDYKYADNTLKTDDSNATEITVAKGDVLTAVWGHTVTFKKHADGDVTSLFVKEGSAVDETKIPEAAGVKGSEPCAKQSEFRGWKQTKPEAYDSTFNKGDVKGQLGAVNADFEYVPVCEAATVQATFKNGDTVLGVQTLTDGKTPTMQFKDAKTGADVDLTKACGDKLAVTGWDKTEKNSGTNGPAAATLFTSAAIWTTAPEELTYTAKCAAPTIKFKTNSGENGKYTVPGIATDQTLDNTGTDFTIGLGENGKYDAGQGDDTVTTPPTLKPTSGKKVVIGWELERAGKKAVYTADLKHFLYSDDADIAKAKPAYKPVGGDVLTVQWGYKVTYQDNKGTTLGVEYVGDNAKPSTKFTTDASGVPVENQSIRTATLCVEDSGIHTGEWKTGKDFNTPADMSQNVSDNMVLRAVCSNQGLTQVKFDAGNGAFAKDAVKDAGKDSLAGKVLTRKGFEGEQINVPAPDDMQPLAGYEFLGWADKADATEAAHKATVTGPKAGKDVTLYAVWKKHEEKIQVKYYKANDGANTGGEVIKFGQGTEEKEYVEVTYNDPAWQPIPGKPEYCAAEGLNFQYWIKADTQVSAGAEPEKYSPVPLVANLDGLKAYCSAKPATPTVTFDAGKGTIKSEFRNPAEIKEGAVTAPTPDQVVAPEGKAFSKWCEAPAEGQELTAETCKDPELTGLTGDKAKAKTVYALYVDSFKVTFDLKGGTPAEGENTEKWSDKDGKVTAPKFTAPTDKVFTKWCEKPADGEAKPDCAEVKLAELTVTKPMNLEAVYKTAVTVKLQSDKGEDVNAAFSVADDTLAKDVPEPENAGDYCKADAAKTVFDKWVMADGKDFAADAKVSKDLVLKAQCKAPVVEHTVKVTVGTETKEIKVVDGQMLTVDQLKTAGVTCKDGEALNLTNTADNKAFDYTKTAVTSDLTLKAECKAKTTPGGSTGGSTGGSSSGGSYFGGGSFGGGSSTPSTPAKDKKPGDKKPGDKKPGAKQPVVNKFDKQFTKKVELPKSAVKRAAGADRVATSVAALSLAKNHEVVVLATGSNFPDALVGGALAGAFKAGVVLTTGATLEQSVLDSLKSYKTKTVHIVGGNGAVSLAKEAQLRAAGLEVIRHAGADRYATAQAVKAATLKALGGKSAISCNATGSNFPDALACSSAASQMGGVVDLVKPGTAVAKDATAKTVCAGGPACQAAGAGVDKVVGSDRYETAYKLAEMTPAKGSVLVSNGQSYADSLVAGALAGSLQADLVLAKPSRVNVPAGTKSAQLFGGTTVLPDSLSMYTK